MESKEKFSSSDIAPLVAGLVGGAVSTILLYPLDLIKVRLQVNETSGCRLSSFTVMNTILKHEGILGLYQGLSPAIVGSAVSWGGYLFFYEGIKKWYRYQKDPNNASNKVYLSATENFVSACASGAILVGLTNPIWLIKTRMQLQLTQASIATGAKKPYRSMFDAFRTIVREEGVVALYKGAIPALVLTSHGGVQFVVYEYLKNSINLSNVERDPSFSVMQRFRRSFSFLMLGATSKIIASTVTYPLQVIKSRLQQRAESLDITSTGDLKMVKRDYSGMFDTIARMWRQEGLRSFFKGAIPNALRVAPGSAITFLVYESILEALHHN